MKPLLMTASVLLVVSFVVVNASACSDVACVGRGLEMHGDFVVTIINDKHPLEGVMVEITRYANGEPSLVLSVLTNVKGRASIRGLAPGDYWLKAQKLGILAAYHCFHVDSAPSTKAKRAVKYKWGDWAPSTARVAGTLIDCQPGRGKNPVLNVVQCTQVPVVAARFRLTNSMTGATFTTASNENGSFAFASIPSGKYVLQVEGGKALDREYDGTDQLIKVSPNAKWDSLLLTRREAAAGSCGGTSLEFRASTRP